MGLFPGILDTNAFLHFRQISLERKFNEKFSSKLLSYQRNYETSQREDIKKNA